jgi:hypothetical protein
MTLTPQATMSPWRLRLHDAGLVALAALFLFGR